MRKLYARYNDDKLVELAIPDSLHIWNTDIGPGAQPIAPIGWHLDGWEGWLDTEDLRSLIIIDENAVAALATSGATDSEISDLQKLVREGTAVRKPTLLEGLPSDYRTNSPERQCHQTDNHSWHEWTDGTSPYFCHGQSADNAAA